MAGWTSLVVKCPGVWFGIPPAIPFVLTGGRMTRSANQEGSIIMSRTTLETDNRDTEQMYEYLEARIDVLRRRVSELELEIQILRGDRAHSRQRSNMSDQLNNARVGASRRCTGN